VLLVSVHDWNRTQADRLMGLRQISIKAGHKSKDTFALSTDKGVDLKNKEGKVSTVVLSIEYLVEKAPEVKIVTRDAPGPDLTRTLTPAAPVPDLPADASASAIASLRRTLAAAQGDLQKAKQEAQEIREAYELRVRELQNSMQQQQIKFQEVQRTSAEMESAHAAQMSEMKQQLQQAQRQRQPPEDGASAAAINETPQSRCQHVQKQFLLWLNTVHMTFQKLTICGNQ
jgi:hypothetical protein